jgi:hypothetical protein
MNKHFVSFALFLSAGILTVQAQCRQDSLFLQQLHSNQKLIEGKTYIFETDVQASSPEFGRSLLYREKDVPVFNPHYSHLTNGIPYAEFKDKTLIFNSVKTGKVKVDEANKPCFILTFTCDKQKYYAYEFSESLLRTKYNLIEADFLNTANKLLVGKTLFTKSAKWYKYNEDKLNSNLKTIAVREGTCKYCPVTVTRVVNDYDDKYLILFKTENQDEEYCFDNVTLNADKSNFTQRLTFENPKKKYPDISQERWEQIMAQKIRKGFTPDEVKVAYGKPDEVYSENDDETWLYYNLNKKDYAITFKDGIVDKVVSQTSKY